MALPAQRWETFTLERMGEVEVLTLNRPANLNTLSQRMCSELLEYTGELEQRELVESRAQLLPRVIVIRANGRAFSAGLDLQDNSLDLENTEGVAFFNFQRRISQVIVNLRRLKQPVISLVQGACCGFGFALALASDVRLATKDARFNVAMAKIGLTGCDIGISYHLPRIVGPSLAAELMYTGDFLSAERAMQAGMLSSVHGSIEEMHKRGLELAQRMCSTMSPSALFMTKEGLKHGINASSLEQAVAMEDRQQLLQLRSSDFPTYVSKFFAKAKL
jgi:enoyl-CoA hydratase/carnithine racemase